MVGPGTATGLGLSPISQGPGDVAVAEPGGRDRARTERTTRVTDAERICLGIFAARTGDIEGGEGKIARGNGGVRSGVGGTGGKAGTGGTPGGSPGTAGSNGNSR